MYTALNIASTIRERIRSGIYESGDWLPAERVLMDELEVDRRSVRAAINILEKEGLLSRRPNCRPIVQAPGSPPLPVETVLAGTQFPASRLVALVMFHGGVSDHAASSQQRIFWGLNEALGLAGYHGVFLDLGDNVGSEQENASIEAAHLRYALEKGFGGVVFYVYAYQSNFELIQEVSSRLPLIFIDRLPPGAKGDFVGVANRQGMYDLTKRLIDLGHERIAYVANGEVINSVLDRQSGYLSAMIDAFGVEAQEIVLTSLFRVSRNWRVFDAVFKQPEGERPTAVICTTDQDAVSVVGRLFALGLKVPEDVSVAGFDNLIQNLPNGVLLTTVAQPFEEIGREAARLFLHRLKHPTAPTERIELPAQVIERTSTADLNSKED
jgi:DNA-binding LacI/PurR family transcriptional regulator